MAAVMVASDSSLSSRISIISLDPAIASQITGTTRTTAPSASNYGSSPRKSTKTPDTEVSRGHVRNVSAPSVSEKKGTTSLRRVKNSTEVLRQRSNKAAARKTKQSLEVVADNVHGRNFTVGNVGNGGMLYLTPSSYQKVNAHVHSVVSTVQVPSTAPALLINSEQTAPPKEKTSTNQSVSSSKSRSTPSRRLAHSIQRPVGLPNHGRSQSFSTIEERQQSYLAPNPAL